MGGVGSGGLIIVCFPKTIVISALVRQRWVGTRVMLEMESSAFAGNAETEEPPTVGRLDYLFNVSQEVAIGSNGGWATAHPSWLPYLRMVHTLL
jgi:hypothetical protein